jgi:hypothetical protein
VRGTYCGGSVEQNTVQLAEHSDLGLLESFNVLGDLRNISERSTGTLTNNELFLGTLTEWLRGGSILSTSTRSIDIDVLFKVLVQLVLRFLGGGASGSSLLGVLLTFRHLAVVARTRYFVDECRIGGQKK